MNKNNGKTFIVSIIIILLVAILMAVTNPHEEGHIQAIKDSYRKKDAVTNVLAQGILAVDPPTYHNAALASYTTYKDKLATVGILGYIWVDDQVFK